MLSQPNLLNNEPVIRFGFFFGILILMGVWEIIAPRRRLFISKSMRWLNNLGLVVLNTLVLRAIFPTAAVGTAAIASQESWGLFNTIALASWQIVLLSLVALDLIIYLQHVLFHALPTLWRLHKVHHGDRDFDVTTALRFHPVEILLSMGIKIISIIFLGIPTIAVFIFEVLLNGTAMFNHSNILLPGKLDRLLRLFIVTPDMHRVHHSVLTLETNSNFGFNLPWWDYLFGTYRANPSVSHQKMMIGLSKYQKDQRVQKLQWMLILPFIRVESSE